MHITVRRLCAILAACFLAACGQMPAATRSGTGGAPLSGADLKYRIVAAVGPLQYCDPDLYPVARVGAVQQNAVRLYPTIRASTDTYAAILRHLDLKDPLDDVQKVAVYAEWKMLNALALRGPPPASFDQVFRTGGDAGNSIDEVAGTVTATGDVHVDGSRPGRLNCPV